MTPPNWNCSGSCSGAGAAGGCTGTCTVGVAPGTTTMQIGGPAAGTHARVWMPYGTDVVDLRGLKAIDTRAHIRWDLILGVGGGALVIAMAAGLLATAFSK